MYMEEKKIFGIYKIVRQPTDIGSPVFWRDLSEDEILVAVTEDEVTACNYSEERNREENPEVWFYPLKRFNELSSIWWNTTYELRSGTDLFGKTIENRVKEKAPDFVMDNFYRQRNRINGIGTTYTYRQDVTLVK